MINKEVRDFAKSKRVKQWEIAEELGMCDSNWSRKMRHELTDTERKNAIEAIERIAERH